ncbi:MAG: hypothetical protein KF819_03300, partial [Labilithrix sp.]|nr:hypothetical protein [Labilithrix sp.]
GVFGRHFMVVGGRLLGGAQVPSTWVGDLSTGIIEDLKLGLGTRRARATVTAFRSSPDQDPAPALVAGGEDPDRESPIGNAEVYVPKAGQPGDLGDFDRVRVELSEPRTKHGAAVLSTGETVLVGGVGSDGKRLPTMEIIDPVTRDYRTGRVQLLQVPRAFPTVLRLASGEIFVAGGTDARGEEITTLEWFSPDLTARSRKSQDLVTGAERGFVALPGGGVLVVIKPKTPTPTFPTVWVISADGTPEPGNPIDPATLDMVRLFPGTEGAPVLWTGRRWMRWDPWFSVFLPIADAQQDGPTPPADDAPPDSHRIPPIASGDDGLALWLDDRGGAGMNVTGFRFATRSRFGTVPSPMLVDGPGGLAPDRVAGFVSSAIRFVTGQGLELGPGAAAFVTDFTFANVTIELEVLGAAPSIVLRQDGGRELEIGGAACPLTRSGTQAIYVERTGKHVRVRVDDGELRECPTELPQGARISVGLRGAAGGGTALARNLRITRR